MKIAIVCLSAVVCFFNTTHSAFGQLKVGLEIRPRTEFRNGFKELREKNEDPAVFTEQRSRLTASYQEDKLFIKFSVQDVRIWGSVPQINKTDGFTSVHEAYGELKLGQTWAIRTGRQEISYDNERILGALDWAAQGRSHDAVKVMYENLAKDFSLHVAGAYNQEGAHTGFTNAEAAKLFGTYYSVNNYKVLTLLHASKTFEKGKISFYMINNGVQRDTAKVYFTHTFGPHFTLNPGKVKLEGSAFYQAGKDNDSVSVNAYLLALAATYPLHKKFFPQIGFDLLSGNDPSAKNNRRAFDPLYGTHHAFYGFMDYFYVGNNHNQPGAGRVGLLDAYAKFRYVINATSALQAHYHYFASPVEVQSETRNMNSLLGHEIDLLYTNKITPSINLTMGYSQMFATDTMEYIKKGRKDVLNNWAFVMISFAPTILNTAAAN